MNPLMSNSARINEFFALVATKLTPCEGDDFINGAAYL
jgi:hypothetical protein